MWWFVLTLGGADATLPGGRRYPVPVPLYAAYGSNMDPDQMKERAPHSPMAGTGWLMGWRLTFGGEDYGPEGGIVATGGLVLGSLYLGIFCRFKEREAPGTSEPPRPAG